MTTLLKNTIIVNEGSQSPSDLRIKNGRIELIAAHIQAKPSDQVIDAKGCLLLPGMIDDQVHFREPGLVHKGCIATESRAAVAGGITSYMEMPNVKPSTTTAQALNDKKNIAKQNSIANYAFYLGATEDNIEEIKRLDPTQVCGIKVFMGASTGDLLVEKPKALEAIFRESPVLIATHCEHGTVISKNLKRYTDTGSTPSIADHPRIRDTEACYASSSIAVDLARKHGSQLHVLHISTAKEIALFTEGPISNKSITAEACVHHLWFSEEDYARLGHLIKCNPAIKAKTDRDALFQALHNGQIDIIATDHAPHTLKEKIQKYAEAPAGLPLVQHALLSLLDHVHAERLDIRQVVEKTAHNPAIRYQIKDRGFLREGYFADLVMVDPETPTHASDESSLYRCKWTPFDGHQFRSSIVGTWVNGEQVFDGRNILEGDLPGAALIFDR